MNTLKRFFPLILIPILSLAILLPEILAGGGLGFTGPDALFHLIRYTDAAMQIQTGHFSYFQQFFTSNASGRIINALYGPLFAYLQGIVLVLVRFHGLYWNIFYCWLINCLGMSSMYYLLRQNKVGKWTSLLLSTAFVITGLASLSYTGGADGMGYALFPLIVAASFRLLSDSDKPIHVWELALAITALAQTHMMSLLLGLALYSLAFITFLVRQLVQKRGFDFILPLIKAILLVLIFNFNIYAAYLDVRLSNSLVMPFRNPVLLPSPFSWADYSQSFVSAAFLILIALSILIILMKTRAADSLFASLIFILFTLLSWNLIPINWLHGVQLLQFNFRFTAIAFPVGMLLIGLALSRYYKNLWTILSLVAFLFSFYYYARSTRADAAAFKNHSFQVATGFSPELYFDAFTRPKLLTTTSFYQTISAQGYSGDADYIPNDSPYKVGPIRSIYPIDPKNTQYFSWFRQNYLTDVYKMPDMQAKNLTRKVSNQGLEISWKSDKPETVTLPVLAYTHTKVIENGKALTKNELKTSYSGALQVNAKAGSNEVLVNYQASKWFDIGMFLSLLSSLGIILYLIFRKVFKSK